MNLVLCLIPGAFRRPVIAIAMCALSGCGAMTTEEKLDGQSHWLTACDVDADCGTASCVCGICSSQCQTDSDCWVAGGTLSSRCAGAETVGCDAIEASKSMCVPDCAGDACISTSSESEETGVVTDRLEVDLHSVPRCPEISPRVSRSLVAALADPTQYKGPVTVDSIASNAAGQLRATLIFNELVGGQATLVYQEPIPALSQGLRFDAVVEAGGTGNMSYAFVTLRDEGGGLVLAAYTGGDALYQQGLFNTPEAIGATFEMRMLCQESVSDGCFENQVQADYEGTFTADNQVVTAGTFYETLTIDGRAYSAHFDGTSIDGEASSCDGFTPGRTLHLGIVAN